MKQIQFFYVNNNEGSTIVVVLLMLMALSLAVIMAMDTSMMNSSMMRNNRDYRDNLYRSESGLTVAAEAHLTDWLDGDSVLFNMANRNAAILDLNATIDDDGDDDTAPVRVAQYDVARIEGADDETANGPLNVNALTLQFYRQPHISATPIGSGNSSGKFVIRRYGIFSDAVNGQNDETTLRIAAGIFKVLPKFE